MNQIDSVHLRSAIAISAKARSNGNHPFGALLVLGDGSVVAEAENTVVTGCDATGHAETNLVRIVSKLLNADQLAKATLYSSCEPCAMCSAAIFWAGIGRIVYALSNDSLIAMVPGGDGPTLDLSCRVVVDAGNRAIVVDGPELEDEAAVPHAGFWT